jgi:hypothetical protein
LRGLSGSGFDDQFWQTDAVNPGIFWESPHPLSIVGVILLRLRHKPNGDPAYPVISGKNSQSFNLSKAASLLDFCIL